MRFHIVGTRPQFLKLASYFKFCGYNEDKDIVIHTGQHYDYEMSTIFFNGLNIPKPTINLGCNNINNLSSQFLEIYDKIHSYFCYDYKDVNVYVYGDCITSLAGALVAHLNRYELHHFEAGVRNEVNIFPEDYIRKTIDHMADVNYCYYDYAINNLNKEGYKGKIVEIDNLQVKLMYSLIGENNIDKINISEIHYMDKDEKYILLTYHRVGNVDNVKLVKLFEVLEKTKKTIVFPCHPRTKKFIDKFDIHVPENVKLIRPVGYLEFIKLLKNCELVITDSGGVQCEAAELMKICITLLDSTTWIHTILCGNKLIGNDFYKIKDIVDKYDSK